MIFARQLPSSCTTSICSALVMDIYLSIRLSTSSASFARFILGDAAPEFKRSGIQRSVNYIAFKDQHRFPRQQHPILGIDNRQGSAGQLDINMLLRRK